MELKIINAGKFKLDGGAMHGVVPKSFWNKHNPADANNLCTWQMRCLLVEDGAKLILIDTGMGNKQPLKWQRYFEPEGHEQLKHNIQKAGYHSSEVTDVLLSHLHFDHAGGAVEQLGEQLLPTFTNAKYWTHSQHWACSQAPNPREKATFLPENLLPLQQSGQLYFIDKQTERPFENIEILTADGHTEKMLMPIINTGKQKIIFAADTAPSAYHLHVPYVMSYDTQPLLTMAEKENLLNMAVAENCILVYDHDLLLESSLVTKTEKGFAATEAGALHSIL
jgi:glyoxylase-like metal-dependent hydrolase (beta-lactamase superfamily II)